MFDWLRKGKATVGGPLAPDPAPSQPPSQPPSPPPSPPPAPAPLQAASAAPSTAALAQAGREFQLAQQALSRGDRQAAAGHLRATVATHPTHVDALTNLGALLRDEGRPDEAEPLLRRALAAQPRAGVAAYNLGLLRVDRQAWDEAVDLLRTATQAMPKDADAACWLGHALMGQGDAEGARQAYRTALRRDARHAGARWGQAMAQLPALAAHESEQVRAPQAFAQELSRLEAWFGSQPALDGSACVGAQQPYYLAYIEADHRVLLQAHGALCANLMARWARRAGLPEPAAASTGNGRRLRIGIVSAHLHSHSVWHALLRGWIEHLDSRRFEIHLFHTGTRNDAETDWAGRRVARLHRGLGDWRAWARCVSDQRLDAILYPEIGMDATTTRLAALRLARWQAASWGHPITSGLPTLDAYLSAQAFEPEGAAAHYGERLICLPGLGSCYRPYGTAPAAVDFRAAGIDDGDRVLLCPGTPFKYGPAHDALWADIARRCAPCKLVFFSPPGSTLGRQLQSRLARAFAAAGVDPASTLRSVPWQSQAAFFAWLDRADVFLDSPGFSGFNTVMQAVERGAPVVAWEGRFMRGRFASAVLRQAGLQEWIALDAEGYAQRVERLCADPVLRQRVRQEVARAAPGLYGTPGSVQALAAMLEAQLGGV